FVALMSGKVRSLFIGNNLLVLSMCLAFGLLLAFCIPHIDIHRLSRVGGTSSYCSLFSLFLGSFGFHGSIPVFCQNLNGHRPSVHRAILGGTLLSGTLYFLFLVSTLGSLPITGETASLEFARIQDVPVTLALGQLMEHQYLFNFLGYAVSVLAIATSLLGVGEGMAQFLKDECPKISLRQGRYIALLIPLLGGSFAPHIFVRGLVWMGVGCEFLFGIVPSLIGIKRFRSQRWGRISMGLFLGFLVALFIELIHLYRSP
ncbi:MAG: hypothetical protein LBR62_00435, partial [Puniceicoccales bacterium]|nr:hypothetical protein [Puniceicoccales bacterium]